HVPPTVLRTASRALGQAHPGRTGGGHQGSGGVLEFGAFTRRPAARVTRALSGAKSRPRRLCGLSELGVQLLGAGGADAVGKIRVRMGLNVALNVIPMALVIADLVAGCANG